MKVSKNNPFRISFQAVSIICCIALSIIFYCVSYSNNKTVQEHYAKEKAELLMSAWDTQLQMMEEVAARISSNYEFHPYYFMENISRELSMLENFMQYRFYITITDDYFLYYGYDRVYRSSGSTLDFELFCRVQAEDDAKRQYLRKELTEWEGEEPKVLSISENIYVLIPLRVSGEEQQIQAVLGFIVKKTALGERFRIVSGNLEGEITLYGEGGVLYSSQDPPVLTKQKNAISVVSLNGLYTICYLPDKTVMHSNLYMLLFLLILTDIFLVLIIANIFAGRAYKPIQALTDKYRDKAFEKKESYENSLEELASILNNMHQSNVEADLQIQEKQKILRNQMLQMLMEGSPASFRILSYLNREEGICLPGPFYCVVSISFEKEENVTRGFLSRIQEELEQISEEENYIYVLCNHDRKLMNVICSIQLMEGKDELVETVCDVAESFAHKPVIGIGNTYQTLNNLSASWLESMDEIYSKQHKNKKHQITVYQSEELHHISAALESGNEAAAMEKLDEYIKKLSKASLSLLMQQYIAVGFLGEVKKIGEKYQMTPSKQSISQLISAKNLQGFEKAAQNVIREFCEGYEKVKDQMEDEEAKRICAYIDEHFAEYDISIENVAASLSVGTAAVRKAVLTYTGKHYKDYLIYLRIEYAKELLLQQDLSVAELCQKVGYGNISYFIKLFRETTGVTPAKYRRDFAGKG